MTAPLFGDAKAVKYLRLVQKATELRDADAHSIVLMTRCRVCHAVVDVDHEVRRTDDTYIDGSMFAFLAVIRLDDSAPCVCGRQE
jgi:hypothetical protein